MANKSSNYQRMILLSHPTGSQYLRAVLQGFTEANLLHQFHTSFALFEGTTLHQLSKLPLFQELTRRQFSTRLKNQIHTYPQYEFKLRLADKLKLFQGSMYKVSQQMDQNIAQKITHLESKEIECIYAYEDMSQRQFNVAKRKGWKCFYDLPIGYWRAHHQLLSEEKKKNPDWSITLTGFDSSPEKLARKDQELELADQIFVASKFTAQTLSYLPEKLNTPVHIVPYGFPKVAKAASQRIYDFEPSKRPLKLLFVGGLSQRKGLSYLFEAAEYFGKEVELTVVGKKVTEKCKPLNDALKKHTWIPTLPHPKILELMQNSDLLIFPSLFEGFGMVMTEAMSQGTPVIATERTAAPDIIVDGVNGFLVKAGSSEAIINKIQAILNSPEQLQRMGKAALQTAKQRPWEVYGQELATTLKGILEHEL